MNYLANGRLDKTGREGGPLIVDSSGKLGLNINIHQVNLV